METTTGRSTGVLADSDDSAVAASGEPEPMRHGSPFQRPAIRAR
jgi:hypothetical protein